MTWPWARAHGEAELVCAGNSGAEASPELWLSNNSYFYSFWVSRD